jgi:hypothetical protein
MDESKYEFFRTFVGHQSFVCQYKKEIGTFFLLASHWCLPIVCIGFRKLDVLFVLQRSGMCRPCPSPSGRQKTKTRRRFLHAIVWFTQKKKKDATLFEVDTFMENASFCVHLFLYHKK